MTRILGLVLGAIFATIRFGPPDADTVDPISGTDAVSGQIERLIEPQARADLFSGVILVQQGDRMVLVARARIFLSWMQTEEPFDIDHARTSLHGVNHA